MQTSKPQKYLNPKPSPKPTPTPKPRNRWPSGWIGFTGGGSTAKLWLGVCSFRQAHRKARNGDLRLWSCKVHYTSLSTLYLDSTKLYYITLYHPILEAHAKLLILHYTKYTGILWRSVLFNVFHAFLIVQTCFVERLGFLECLCTNSS